MDQISRAVLKIISILIIVMILLKLSLVFLSPFVISIILVIILEPIVKTINNFGASRRLSVIISIVLLLGIIFFTVYYLSRIIYSQLNSLVDNLPDIIALLKLKFTFLKNINLDYENILKTINEVLPTYKEKIINTIISTANWIIYIIIITMTTLFLSMDLYKITGVFKKYIPSNIYSIFSKSIFKVNKIISTQAKLIGISTILTIIGLYILKAEEPLTIGIICGILDLIPVVGPSLIFIPWIIFSVFIGKYFFALGLLLLSIFIQISRQIMEIKFVGNNLKIHPVVTIFSLYIGIIIYGVWGVIFGPFIVILLKEIIDKYLERGYRFTI